MGEKFWRGLASGTSNRWDHAGNWTGQAAPGPSDYAYITSSGDYSVRILASDPAYTLRYLQTGTDDGSVALIDAGSLTVRQSFYIVGGGFDVTASGSAYAAGLSLTNGAELSVEGAARFGSVDSFRGSSVKIDGGSLRIGTALDSSRYVLSAGGTLEITKVASSRDTVRFARGGGEFTYAGAAHTLATRFVGFRAGDTIDIKSLALKGGYTYAYSGRMLTLTNQGNPALTFTFDSINDPAKGLRITRDGAGGTLISVACFASGTRLRTATGDVAVDDLRVGDLVVTGSAGGPLRPVTWIGSRRIDLKTHPRADLVAPIRVLRDAMGQGLPERDLLLSPDHAVFLDGALVPVHLLVNGMTIVQHRPAASVRYVHVELDRHSVVLAEGLPTESYLDTGNRALLDGGPVSVLHPVFGGTATQAETYARLGCAPLATDVAQVKPIWDRLQARALGMGHIVPARAGRSAHDLVLFADGIRLRTVVDRPHQKVFALPPGTAELRLASGAASPAETAPYLDDRRMLGVCVRRLTLRTDGALTVVPLDHPGLCAGWHEPEHGLDEWRWTDGSATLRHPGLAGASLATIDLAGASHPDDIRNAA